MLKVDRQTKLLTPIKTTSFAEAKILECQDLQAYVAQNFDAFADEIEESPELRLIGREFHPSDIVSDRIDLLAVDGVGTCVVIELKRSKDKRQLLQALAYAAMVAKLDKEGIRRRLREGNTLDDGHASAFNQDQRIILVAEAYDYEVLVAAEWLSNQDHNIDIKCVRVALLQDVDTNSEYLNFTVVFPPTALEDEAKVRRAKTRGVASQTADSWEAVIATSDNEAVKSFFKTYVDQGQENRLAYKTLHFRIDNSRRFAVGIIGPDDAGVEQIGRFVGDLEYWKAKLDQASGLRVVFGGRRLRFRLQSPQDFAAFTSAIASDLKSKTWERTAPITALDEPPTPDTTTN